MSTCRCCMPGPPAAPMTAPSWAGSPNGRAGAAPRPSESGSAAGWRARRRCRSCRPAGSKPARQTPERPMAKDDGALLLSVLDRLLADEAEPAMRGGVQRGARSLAEIRNGVRRDLENLLNTRARPIAWPEAWDELRSALTGYGLPDFTALSMTSA